METSTKKNSRVIVAALTILCLMASLFLTSFGQAKYDFVKLTLDYCGGTSPNGNPTETYFIGGTNFPLESDFQTAPKEGMKIVGWYTDKNYSEESRVIYYYSKYNWGEPNDFNTYFKEDTTLYAKWAEYYSVRLTGASIREDVYQLTENTYYAEKGKAVHIMEDIYPLSLDDEYLDFGGYYTAPNGSGTNLTPDYKYVNFELGKNHWIVDSTFTPTSDLTLYAFWYTPKGDSLPLSNSVQYYGLVDGDSTRLTIVGGYEYEDYPVYAAPESWLIANGISYDESSNTLMLNNTKLPGSLLFYGMAEGFKLVIKGECELEKLQIESYDEDSTISLGGSGTLTVTNCVIFSGGGQSGIPHLHIQNGPTVYLKADGRPIWCNAQLEGQLSALVTYDCNIDKPIEFEQLDSEQLGQFVSKATQYTFTPDDEKIILNGIVQGPDGKWAMYKNGKADTSYTGIAKNKHGWWRVEKGYVNFKANGIYKNQYGWWKTTDGKVIFDETGVFKNEHGWWRVKDSKVDFEANGIYKNQYGWWKTTKGKVTFKENGVFKNEYGWWIVEKSKVNFKFTGIAKNDYGTWYVKNGKVDFNKNGKVKYNGTTYTIKNGKVQ